MDQRATGWLRADAVTSPRVLNMWARLQKLRAMSAAEIVHRVRYRQVVNSERRRHRAGSLTPDDRLRRALGDHGHGSDWLSRLTTRRRINQRLFLPSVNERNAIRQLFQTRYAAEAADTVRRAADARSHRFSFFGQSFEFDDIPWQADPVTGRQWPAVYHADVPVHGGDVGYGDVKHVWELSRQQFLIDIGKSWFLFENKEDLDALRQLVRSWIAGNPYATGVNWACALEPAFRIFSWLWAYHFTLDALDDEFHQEWLEALYDHGRFLEQHLEHYSSPYNHLIAEAAALYMVGACFPELRDAARWRSTGTAVMTRRLAEQFYADGGSVEQSTFYHHATVGFYLLAGLTARSTHEDLSPDIWRAIERGLEFSAALSQPDGSTPSIGGADDGKPIRLEHLRLWDFRPYLAAGAVVFNRADFKSVAGRFHEDALWLTGVAGLQAFGRLPVEPPRYGSIALPASGYVVLRSDFGECADYVCFDCGEQAAGMRQDAVPNSMHGHADCLSVIAWLGGTRILVDSGFYSYNAGGKWEAHFRETAAHNTVRVDGRDQARHIGKMAWSHSYRATLESSQVDGACFWTVGSHDGYSKGPNGVGHRRAVFLRPGTYFLVADELTGSGMHDVEVNYQFAPGTLDITGPQKARFNDTVELMWSASEPVAPAIACGGPGPSDGWIASSLGVREAAPRLTLRADTSRARTCFLTVFTSSVQQGAISLVDISGQEFGGPALAVISDHTVDLVTSGHHTTGCPVRSDAAFVICRVPLRHGAIETYALGGTSVDVDQNALRSALTTRLGTREDRS